MVGSAAIKQGRSANRKHTYFFFWPHVSGRVMGIYFVRNLHLLPFFV